MHLHIKCLIFLAKDEEDAESSLCNNDWVNSQGTADMQKWKCCLTLGDDAYLWYESIAFVGKDWGHLQVFL